MPKSRITKTTEKLLLVKKKATGLSNPQIIELAVMRLDSIPLSKVKVKVRFRRRKKDE